MRSRLSSFSRIQWCTLSPSVSLLRQGPCLDLRLRLGPIRGPLRGAVVAARTWISPMAEMLCLSFFRKKQMSLPTILAIAFAAKKTSHHALHPEPEPGASTGAPRNWPNRSNSREV